VAVTIGGGAGGEKRGAQITVEEKEIRREYTNERVGENGWGGGRYVYKHTSGSVVRDQGHFYNPATTRS